MRAVLFLLALLALQMVPGVGVRDARAVDMTWQTSPCYTASATNYPLACTPDQAYAVCQAARQWPVANDNVNHSSITQCTALTAPAGKHSWRFTWVSNFGSPGTTQYFNSGSPCAVGEWNETTKTCFDSGQCLAKEAFGSGGSLVLSNNEKRCKEGCQFAWQGGKQTVSFNGGASNVIGYAGSFVANGLPCGTEPAPDMSDNDPPRQQCVPVDGMTMCIRDDGQHCATASSGRQICWRPGETGEKTDGNVMQTRGAGSTPQAPQAPPPAGDSFAPQGSPVTENTSMGGGFSIGTVIQNYGTTSGANAGGAAPDQGENVDGSDGPSSGNTGDGDGGDDGSVSGGADCENAPVVSGDPILAAIVLQTWGTRCAAESQNAVHSSGNIQDCHDNFVVTGPEGDANVAKLQGIRAQICGHYGDDDGDGQPDWTKPEGDEAGDGDEANDGEPGVSFINLNVPAMIDTSGWLSGFGAVPPLGTLDFGPFGEHSLDDTTWWPNLVQAIHALMLLLGAWVSCQILLKL